ncbi:hypothetical protein FB451DRAFT_1363884 [Mycena latifolia]|nr:hypothetical protein FB451DRAFT_1363884 [Mycena latifolia]
MSIFQAHPPYYRHFLYSAIVEATARDETSLRDLPAELIIKILAMAVLSSRTTGLALALTSPWIPDATLPARLAHVSLHTSRHVRSFHGLVCSSPRAAGAVRTLWIGSSIGWEGDLLIPAFLTACTDIQALVCRLGPLENLCTSKEPLPPWLLSVRLTLPEFFPRVWPGSRTILFNRLAGTTRARGEFDLPPAGGARISTNQPRSTRELVQAVREYGSSILACCLPHYQFRASKFWAECVADGEDVWSLAQKQASLFSGASED